MIILLGSSPICALLILLAHSTLFPFFLTRTTEEAPPVVVMRGICYIGYERLSTYHNIRYSKTGNTDRLYLYYLPLLQAEMQAQPYPLVAPVTLEAPAGSAALVVPGMGSRQNPGSPSPQNPSADGDEKHQMPCAKGSTYLWNNMYGQ
jgi:hypothetical protein